MRKAVKALTCTAIALACSSVMARGGGGHSSGSHSFGSSHTYGSHSTPSSSLGSTGSHSVRGYTMRNGTYVAPHHATNPDSTTKNNWTHKGNVNPYTGKEGTKSD